MTSKKTFTIEYYSTLILSVETKYHIFWVLCLEQSSSRTLISLHLQATLCFSIFYYLGIYNNFTIIFYFFGWTFSKTSTVLRRYWSVVKLSTNLWLFGPTLDQTYHIENDFSYARCSENRFHPSVASLGLSCQIRFLNGYKYIFYLASNILSSLKVREYRTSYAYIQYFLKEGWI